MSASMGSRQGKGAAHLSLVALASHVGSLLLLLFAFLFDMDGHGATFCRDLQFLWLDTWHGCLNHVLLLILRLSDVDGEKAASAKELEARSDYYSPTFDISWP